jgi:putative endonuclease
MPRSDSRSRFGRNLRKHFRRLTLCEPLTRIYDQFSNQLTLGQRGEREAERFLLRRGWITIERNYCDHFGEIDLVMADDETVVFVEVKTRAIEDGTSPAEAVDEVKIERFTKTAQGFVRRFGLEECRLRFDVVAIKWPDTNQRPSIEHFAAAFEPAGEFQMF